MLSPRGTPGAVVFAHSAARQLRRSRARGTAQSSLPARPRGAARGAVLRRVRAVSRGLPAAPPGPVCPCPGSAHARWEVAGEVPAACDLRPDSVLLPLQQLVVENKEEKAIACRRTYKEAALRTRCLALIPVLVARVTAGGASVGRAGGAPGAGSDAAGSGPSLSGPVLEEEPVRAEGAAERRGAGAARSVAWRLPGKAATGGGRAVRRDRRQKPLRVGAGRRRRRFPEPRGAALGRASGCVSDGRAL
ncbi:unnamed protein product [Bubo scandiacus]